MLWIEKLPRCQNRRRGGDLFQTYSIDSIYWVRFVKEFAIFWRYHPAGLLRERYYSAEIEV